VSGIFLDAAFIFVQSINEEAEPIILEYSLMAHQPREGLSYLAGFERNDGEAAD
jgi:hypothetical protein